MKFETIKKNAKALFSDGVEMFAGRGSPASFAALLPFVLATKAEREEMRDFAEAFIAPTGDWLANYAKSKKSDAWALMVLRAREAGFKLIDGWDVRRVGKLVELFPQSVPSKYRGKQLTCYMADNSSFDWMVEASK